MIKGHTNRDKHTTTTTNTLNHTLLTLAHAQITSHRAERTPTEAQAQARAYRRHIARCKYTHLTDP